MASVIVLVNFVFSVVGLIFIVKVWKDQRDDMKEFQGAFAIPKGRDKTRQNKKSRNRSEQELSKPQLDEDLIRAYLAAIAERDAEEADEKQPYYTEGDMDKFARDMAAGLDGGR